MLTTVPSRLQGINILFLLSNQTDLSNGNLIETKTYPVLIIIFPLQNSYFHKIWTLKNTMPCFRLAVILWLFKWTYLCNCNSFFYIFDIKIQKGPKKMACLYMLACQWHGVFFFFFIIWLMNIFRRKSIIFFTLEWISFLLPVNAIRTITIATNGDAWKECSQSFR